MNRQRKGTRFSKDGTTAFVRLQVDRRDYELAMWWAHVNGGHPDTTAEDMLEGTLNMAMLGARPDDWQLPPEIDALYPPPNPRDDDEEIPF